MTLRRWGTRWSRRMVAPVTLLALTAAGTAFAGELRATVRNVRPNQGKVMVALFDSAEAQAAKAPRAGYFVAALGTELQVVFPDLPAGRYGLIAFQDLDNNGELATGLFGIPAEPHGFSRSARGSFGPPGFDDYAVAVGAAGVATTEIRLVE
ncbi:DUF2141 domain-containing protein [Azospirillum sp. B506]|uniref:DUF2141 domain-containing protein n=1 Tax=Azospirillum sp. B506 TaxID=137721 RepID=UPI0005B289F9|nr:DUF2141 domain-containing protein [Azospirillum sp. B506]